MLQALFYASRNMPWFASILFSSIHTELLTYSYTEIMRTLPGITVQSRSERPRNSMARPPSLYSARTPLMPAGVSTPTSPREVLCRAISLCVLTTSNGWVSRAAVSEEKAPTYNDHPFLDTRGTMMTYLPPEFPEQI